MGGGQKQFGIDEEKMEEICNKTKLLKNVEIIGVHCYLGTQNLKASQLISNFQVALEIAKKIQNYVKKQLQFIDLGGGFGIPLYEGDDPINLYEFSKIFAGIFKNSKKYFSNSCKFFLESGRFIVGKSGYFICKIIDKKESRGKNFLLVDGGTNCGPTSYINGKFLRRNPMLSFFSNQKKEKEFLADIVGPLCTPTDILAQNVKFPVELEIGDYVIIKNAGAYGYSAASKDFLSHLYPEEVLVNGLEAKLIRRKNSLEDLLKYFE